MLVPSDHDGGGYTCTDSRMLFWNDWPPHETQLHHASPELTEVTDEQKFKAGEDCTKSLAQSPILKMVKLKAKMLKQLVLPLTQGLTHQ